MIMTTLFHRSPAAAVRAVARSIPGATLHFFAPRRGPGFAAAAALAIGCVLAPAAAAQHTHDHGERHAHAHAAATTVIVVRHAERADEGTSRDPDLSDAGRLRAEALADALAGAGVTGIITTQFQRTRATAAPLAERTGVAVQVVETGGAAGDHVRAVVEAATGRYAGGVVLVVGHSNTVPAIVRALGGRDIADMPEHEYGTMYVVTVQDAAVRVLRAKF